MPNIPYSGSRSCYASCWTVPYIPGFSGYRKMTLLPHFSPHRVPKAQTAVTPQPYPYIDRYKRSGSGKHFLRGSTQPALENENRSTHHWRIGPCVSPMNSCGCCPLYISLFSFFLIKLVELFITEYVLMVILSRARCPDSRSFSNC